MTAPLGDFDDSYFIIWFLLSKSNYYWLFDLTAYSIDLKQLSTVGKIIFDYLITVLNNVLLYNSQDLCGGSHLWQHEKTHVSLSVDVFVTRAGYNWQGYETCLTLLC